MQAVENTDVLIVGGGMVGLTLAQALAAHGLTSTVIEQADLTRQAEAGFDGRAFAIASASARMLEALGIWQHLDGAAQPIREIRVTDDNHPRFLTFDRKSDTEEPHGYLVEARLLRQALLKSLTTSPDSLKHVRIHDGTTVSALMRGPVHAEITLESGAVHRAPLLVAADGRRSMVREKIGIRVAQWRYRQVAISTTVAHEFPHGGVAHELFLRDEPFAILPVTGNRSNIVWIVPENRAAAYLALSDRAFLHEVKKRFGDFLGDLSLAAPRWSYPLGFLHAEKYTTNRAVVIGDAAHGIHPIAGQGLNLGMRDVAALTEVLVDAARLGLDVGTETVLARYQRWRYADNALTAAAMDGIVRLFDMKSKPVVAARRLGLGVVNKMPRLKTFLESQARGKSGNMPKLLTGEQI